MDGIPSLGFPNEKWYGKLYSCRPDDVLTVFVEEGYRSSTQRYGFNIFVQPYKVTYYAGDILVARALIEEIIAEHQRGQATSLLKEHRNGTV